MKVSRRVALFLLACAAAALTNCGGDGAPQALRRINDTCMYISSNPIVPGQPVVFELRPARDQLRNIRENLRGKTGPAGCSVTPKDGHKVNLWEVEAKSRTAERLVSVKQAEVVLYEARQAVTEENLQGLAHVRIESSDWKHSVSPAAGDVEFCVEYRLHWDMGELGRHTGLIRSDSCRIPVLEDGSRQPSVAR